MKRYITSHSRWLFAVVAALAAGVFVLQACMAQEQGRYTPFAPFGPAPAASGVSEARNELQPTPADALEAPPGPPPPGQSIPNINVGGSNSTGGRDTTTFGGRNRDGRDDREGSRSGQLLSPDFPDGIPASSIDVSARQWEQDSRRWKVQISEATAALHAAKNDQQKTELTKRLSDLLNEYFERDLQHREAELAPLEERVRNLRAQLDRRREKKQEIIDLQIKVAVNEADGLGFFSPPAGAPRGSMLPPR